MFFIVLAATLVGVVAILKATADAANPASVGDLVRQIIEQPRPLAADLNRAAQMLSAEGYHQTAEALRDKGDIAHALERATKELTSPIPGIPPSSWEAFVELCKGKKVREISPSYQFGLFNIGFRRLADLGLASGVRRGLHHNRSVWHGKFIEPLTLEKFLSDPTIQYKVFCKDMVERHRLITGTHQDVIGTPLEGVTVSLSGLLAVAKLAGAAGLATWIRNAEERKKFSQTTAAFLLANGIF